MNRRHLRIALPLFALFLPTARTASATPPEPSMPTAVVEKLLVKPLADKEAHQSRFSRAYVPPQERRVRVLESERSTDARGAEFMTFAVDERSGGLGRRPPEDWRKDAIVGCVYPARDEVFIKRGDKFFAATLLLGKRTPPADEAICRPARVAAADAHQ